MVAFAASRLRPCADRAATVVWLAVLTGAAWAEGARPKQSTWDTLVELSWVFALVIVMLAAMGGWFYYKGHKAQKRAEASANWPTAAGKVLETSVQVHRRAKGGTSFEPKIRYEYAVAGARLEATVIQFGLMNQVSQAAAETLLAPYPVGGPVKVYYDPADPKTATLDTSAFNAKMLKWVGIGVFVVGVAIVGVVVWLVLRTG